MEGREEEMHKFQQGAKASVVGFFSPLDLKSAFYLLTSICNLRQTYGASHVNFTDRP